MSRSGLVSFIAALGVSAFAGATPASAQVLGTFPWQMQPYCNIVTLTLTTTAAGFTLDGTDDQCGATNKASAVGVASFSGAGNVTLNFTIVTAPSGKPVHVSAVVSPANGAGTWTDSVGHTGTFAFFGATSGLPVRPLPAAGLSASSITTIEIAPAAVGASDINTAEVQARVSGACPAGQAMTGVNSNGTVACAVTGALTTIRGVFNVSFDATAGYQEMTGALSFGVTLASAPIVHLIAPGVAGPAACPGNSLLPAAAAGHLCLYQQERVNVVAECLAHTGGIYVCETADRFGATVYVVAAAPGNTRSLGSWALGVP